jgi:SIR2-like domain
VLRAVPLSGRSEGGLFGPAAPACGALHPALAEPKEYIRYCVRLRFPLDCATLGAYVMDETVAEPRTGAAQGHDPAECIGVLLEKLGQPRRHLSMLLGAGTSMAAGLPDLAALGAAVRARLNESEQALYDRLFEGRNLENVLSNLRLARSLLVSAGGEFDGLTAETAGNLDRSITRAIAAIVAREEDAPIEAHERLAAWLGRSIRVSAIEVFTTNYDLLLERAFELRGVPYFDGFVGVFRGEFRPDLIEPDEAPESSRPPLGWVRLWKLHGSVSWVIDDASVRRIVRLGRYPVESPGAMLAIYPSAEKYEESRRMPFLALTDRFRRALATPESTTVTVGYSFGDQHLNELIFTAAARYQRSEIIALFRGAIPPIVAEQATQFANLSAYGATEAVLGGEHGEYRPMATGPGTDGRQVLVGDFARLTELLTKAERLPAAEATEG